MSFKEHLEMISLNESPTKKAKFWQSFVRSLKGSDDIRATDSVHSRRGIFRPISDLPELSSNWPFSKSIYDDPSAAAERIHGPGYRYDPLHRDIYGYSPRAIFPHNYGSLDRYRPAFHITKPRPFDADSAWRDHIDRVKGREPTQWPSNIFHTTYPFSRYPLYLVYSKRPPPPTDKYDPHRSWLDHLDRLGELDKLYPTLWPSIGSRLSPTPTKDRESSVKPIYSYPRDSYPTTSLPTNSYPSNNSPSIYPYSRYGLYLVYKKLPPPVDRYDSHWWNI